MKNLKPLMSTLMLTATSMVFANPEGFQPLAGDASISLSNANTLEITTGKQAVIQWNSFSIDTSETTRFVMPDSKSAVLNRVKEGNVSEILGTLEANGKVFLINPKGVLVGDKASVNTASFIASSYDVLNDEFMKGGDIAFKGDSGSIINLGKITASDGDVILVGFQVTNNGEIDASHGVAALAAGTEIYLKPANNEKILIRAQLSEIIGDVGISNTGVIQALQTELKADGNIYSVAIKDSGKIDALTKCRRLDNKIYLIAEEGKVETSGQLTAPSGEIRLLGNEIAVANGANINVTSEKGGGVILIGGDFQGNNPEILNASYVTIEEDTLIQADALMEGDGGQVIVWGDILNNFYGTITARGGALEGNGGFVEVSSSGIIVPMGHVNTLAPNGLTGNLLFDPAAVIISAPPAMQGGFAPVPPCPTPPVSFDFTGNASSTIYASTIQALLSCTNVTVNASATGTAATGTITLLSPISWSSASTLTFVATDASSFIDIYANLSSSNGTFVANGQQVNIGSTTGSLTSAVAVNVNTVNITTTGNLNIYGSNTSSASSQISGHTISLTSGGNLNIQGGNANSAYAAVKALGTASSLASITALVTGNVSLTAGNGTSSSSAMTANNGTIQIGSLSPSAPVAQLTLTASNLSSYANSFIATYTSGGIDITSTGEVLLQAGLMPGANANIFTQGSDNNDCHINITTLSGDVVLLGGGG